MRSIVNSPWENWDKGKGAGLGGGRRPWSLPTSHNSYKLDELFHEYEFTSAATDRVVGWFGEVSHKLQESLSDTN